jgi:protein-disulfide isomerase-like protein with CxxC motif
MIGLAERSQDYVDRGYTPAMNTAGWRVFERRFGMPFSFQLKERVAGTSRACRAIVAARRVGAAQAEAALFALQLMHFASPRLLDEDDDIRATLAAIKGLDAAAIVESIGAPHVVADDAADKTAARSADGSPTHVQGRFATTDGPVRYTAPSVIFEHAEGRRLEVGGFQPFEAYDTVLANLDTSLERRPPPADAVEALAAFPLGLTTAEVAAVLRPSDLVDADIPATQGQLAHLAGEGRIACQPVGGDAFWRLAKG